MTDQATRVVPAGWYEDPASPAHVRWWNGLAWTEHTAAKPESRVTAQPAADQTAAQGAGYGQSGYGQSAGYDQASSAQSAYGQAAQDAAAQARAAAQAGAAAQAAEHTSADAWYTTPESQAESARIAEARELEREFGISTAEHEVVQQRHDQAAVDDAYRADWGADEEEPPTSTASAWLIALWPVFTLAAAAAAAYLYFYVQPELYVLGLGAVPLLLTVLWAIADARRLRQLGHRPASAALALLGPFVYLVARRVRVRGSGPLVAFLIFTATAVGLPVAAVATDSARPVTTALEIQQTVSADLIGDGRATSVNCPFFVEDFSTGALYTCSVKLPNGASTVVWVSIDGEDGEFSYALSAR